jgi:hypothetical protein
MATTSIRLAPDATPNLQFVVLAIGAFIALASGRRSPFVVIIGSACLGPLLV